MLHIYGIYYQIKNEIKETADMLSFKSFIMTYEMNNYIVRS